MDSPYLIRLEPKTRTDQERMGAVLYDLAGRESSLLFETDSDSGQIVIYGSTEEQLENIVERLVREHVFEVNAAKPEVAYRETILKSAEAEGRYIRQTGGAGNYGHVKIFIEPNERGNGFEFLSAIRGGVVPGEYFPAVEQGIREAMRGGVLAGYELVDIKATLFDGSYHDVDSNEMAFTIAGSMAFKEAARKATPVVLEPVMAIEAVVPEQFMGAIVRDLNSRRGRIVGLEQRAELQALKAVVPLSEMSGYAKQMASATNGRATWSMRFRRYEQRPYWDGFGYGEQPGTPVRKGPQPGVFPRGRASHSETDF